jgi:hypothetical protein
MMFVLLPAPKCPTSKAMPPGEPDLEEKHVSSWLVRVPKCLHNAAMLRGVYKYPLSLPPRLLFFITQALFFNHQK